MLSAGGGIEASYLCFQMCFVNFFIKRPNPFSKALGVGIGWYDIGGQCREAKVFIGVPARTTFRVISDALTFKALKDCINNFGFRACFGIESTTNAGDVS